MAANDYYNTSFSPSGQASHPQRPFDDTHHNRTDAPLPPVPGNQSQQSISPVTSPFDDHRYDYPSNANSQAALGAAYSDTAYHGSTGPQFDNHNNRYDPPAHSHSQTDPFADQNAIPLQNQGKMGTHPAPYGADPERLYPGEKRKKKKKGWFSGKITWFVYIMTTIQIGVFVGELIKNGILTGTPIATKPSFNIMIGPSPYVLINMGARFTPCMHNIQKVIDNKVSEWPCPDTTSLADNAPKCSLKQLCGMSGGVPDNQPAASFRDRSNEPDQWWRFITPIFLHAGLIHIGFNMLLQLTLGRDMEKEIGPLRFALVYFSSGIFGFVLGGNYAAEGISSVGASGALFGILALVLVDLLFNWNQRRSPVKDLLFLLLDVAIAFVLGLLPGLDNFSHIGGFLMGIVLGICLLHSPQALRERIGVDEPPYSTVDTTVDTQPLNSSSATTGVQKFVKQPVGFFKGRKPLWWAWWLVRAGMLVTVFIGFILLLRNFYEWRNTCSWCQHLTCLPITTNGVKWCDIGALTFNDTKNDTQKSGGSKRGLEPIDLAVFLAESAGF